MNGMGRHALMPAGSAGDPAFAAGVKHFILSGRHSVSKSHGLGVWGLAGRNPKWRERRSAGTYLPLPLGDFSDP
jgi:hypothetical protein